MSKPLALTKHTAFLAQWVTKYGQSALVTDPSELLAFQTDWRKRYIGCADCVLLPPTAKAAQQAIQYCIDHRIPITPQGGNTGLVGGAVCTREGGWIINTRRLRDHAQVDTNNRTMTVSAGLTLHEAQQLAAQSGLLFPLSLASEGSCTIGGNIASNAGGTAVLRYGNTRELVLGLEVVLPDGSLWSDLRGLRKNNAGYDIKQLLIGSEGTMGLVTAATVRLFSQPKHVLCGLLAMNGPQEALAVLNGLLAQFDSQLTTFEWMSQAAIDLVVEQFGLQLPFVPAPSYVLFEISVFNDDASGSRTSLENWLASALHTQVINNGVLAQNLSQRETLWALRENISEAQAKTGLNIKHDIALPVSRVPEFIATIEPELFAMCPGVRPIVFGHMGDGNLHFNVSAPKGLNAADFLSRFEAAMNDLVYKQVVSMGGTISAEHGIGLLKRHALEKYSPASQLAYQRQVKKALDTHALFNPDQVFTPS